MELKVGMYVRTEEGHIDKIIKISDEIKSGRTIKVQIGEKDIIGGYEDFVDWFSPSHFIKSSYKPINLVQVGDYVNGLRVEKSKYGELYIAYVYMGGDIGRMPELYITFIKDLKEDEIYSIVTREEFESRKYEVE